MAASSYTVVLHCEADNLAPPPQQFTCPAERIGALGEYFVSAAHFSSLNGGDDAVINVHVDSLLYLDWLCQEEGIAPHVLPTLVRSFFVDVCLRAFVRMPPDVHYALNVYLAHAFGNAAVLARLWPPLDTVPLCNGAVFALLCRLVGSLHSTSSQRLHSMQALHRRVMRVAPDVLHAATRSFEALYQYEEALLRRPDEPLIQVRRDALALDAHAFAARPEPAEFVRRCQNPFPPEQMLVPPPSMRSNEPWLLSIETARKRLKWATRGLLSSRWPFAGLPVVLSGSLLPLCFLSTVYKSDTREHFLSYAEENYRRRSLDLFIYTAEAERVRAEVLRRLGQRCADSLTLVRTYRHLACDVYEYVAAASERVQLICMPGAERPIDTFLFHHLPLVRACYTGEALLVTPMCLASWRYRTCMGYVHFSKEVGGGADTEEWGDAVPEDVRRHWSRLVLKWATRGFAFPRHPSWTLPRRILEWVQEDVDASLPWYHPLYAPSSWHRFLSDEEVLACWDCAL